MKSLPLILAVLLGGFGWNVAVAGLQEEMISPEWVLSRAAELSLSAEQQSAIRRSTEEFHAPMGRLLREMQRESAALIQSLQDRQTPEAQVLAQFDKLNDVETRLKRVRLQMTLRTRPHLTAEQIQRATALRTAASPPPDLRPGSLPDKLRRVKAGIERWTKEGRDTAEINSLWEKFRAAESRGHYGEARRALDAALALVDSDPSAPVTTDR